jgi:hypothetical protein
LLSDAKGIYRFPHRPAPRESSGWFKAIEAPDGFDDNPAEMAPLG